MKNFVQILFIILFFSQLIISQTISWEQLSGPHGGTIYSTVVDGDGNLYASPTGIAGPYKSTDNGETWFSIENGLTPYEGEFHPLNISPYGDLFIGGAHSTALLCRSTDSGNTWDPLYNLNTNGGSVICISFDNSYNVYVGTGQGIFKSTDDGDTWALYGNFTGQTEAIAFNDSGHIFVGNSYCVYRSTDDGVNWTQLPTGGGTRTAAVAPNGYVYAGCWENAGILRSTDNGDSWTYVYPQTVSVRYASTILFDSNGDIYFPTWGKGVLKSTDDGDTWTEMNNNLGTRNVRVIARDLSGNFFASEDYGIFKSTDNCESWYSVGLPLAAVSKILMTSDDNIYTVEWGMNRSTDFGHTWQTINSGLGHLDVRALTVNSNGYMFAGIADNQNGIIFRSSDQGESWARVDNFPTGLGIRGLASGPNGEVVAVGTGYSYILHMSTDDGLTWNDISYNLTDEFPYLGVSSVAINSAGDMFIITNYEVWRKLATDTIWTVCSGSGCGSYATILIASNGYIFTEYTKSTDNGDTWTTNNFPTFITSYAENSLGHLFAGTSNWGQGVYRSTDYAETWEQINDGLPIMDIHSVGVDANDYLYAGSWGMSMFKSTTPTDFQFDDSALIAFYKFEGNANDSSGYGNDGSVIDAVLTTDRFGNENSAYEFNGSGSYITAPNSLSLQSPSTELTQNTWVYLYSWGNGGNWAPVIMKSNSSSNAFQYRLSIGTNGINTSINNWDNSVITPYILNFNEWYMITSVLKDDTVKHYVNAEYIGSGTLTGPILSDSKPLEIGRDVPGSTEYYNGKIDDIRIYNRAVTQDEIDSLYGTAVGISSDNDPGIPLKFNLEQNYPNPFNPTTSIQYTVSSRQFVTLKVYDILGNEVETLVNEYKPKGKYNIEFNREDLSSGVYFYKLTAGSYTAVKKMLLLK